MEMNQTLQKTMTNLDTRCHMELFFCQRIKEVCLQSLRSNVVSRLGLTTTEWIRRSASLAHARQLWNGEGLWWFAEVEALASFLWRFGESIFVWKCGEEGGQIGSVPSHCQQNEWHEVHRSRANDRVFVSQRMYRCAGWSKGFPILRPCADVKYVVGIWC